MPRQLLEQLRLPAGTLLLLVVAFIHFPREGEADPIPSPSIITGEPGGEALPPSDDPTPVAERTPIPTLTPVGTPSPEATPEATPPPVSANGFSAEMLVCRSISGSTCNNQVSDLPPDESSFTALVRFSNASAGDAINAILSGPSGTISGGAYTLRGGGDGYYYSTFQAGALPPGDYVVTATRNGAEVAETSFRKVGG